MEDESETKKNRTWMNRISDMLSREPKDKEALTETLRDAADRDLLSPEMLSMIESVLQVSEMQVREIMVPKSLMVSVQSDSTLEEVLPLVIESGHSRFPIIDKDNEDVLGIMLAKDLLAYGFKKELRQFKMSDIQRPATFVPQSKRLDILLKEFRINHNHMAIVINEYGHVAGLITIEDVLEQIVGDIEDEYDTDEDDYVKKTAENTYTVKASIPIKDFNEYFSTDFDDEEFDTMGGVLLKGFGHLPKRSEVLKLKNFKFKILHSDNRRIHLLEVRREVE